jgi:flagellin
MSLGLANNVSALNAQNNLIRSTSKLNTSIERLSSGFKINRGADGPAALVISEKQRAQISGLRAAIDNTEKAVSVVQTAEGALNEINSLLVKARSLAIDSANSGVNDEDALAANQAEITNALDTINRIANNTQFGEKKLLDGTSGISGTASDADVTFLKANSNTSPGTYAISVTQEAEAASTSAGTAQTAALANAEVLTINGTNITLNAGLTQDQVVDRINEFTDQTGVIAEDDPSDADTTRLRTSQFGDDASIDVVSNTAAAADSSGFGTSTTSVTGTDVAGTIGGNAAQGNGRVLTGTAGLSEGVQVQIGVDPGDATSSVGGTGNEAQGDVTVTSNALVFQIGANQGQTVQIAIDSVAATGLGTGVTGNSFSSLNDINVTSAANAQDTLGIIDAAIDEISNLRGTLGAFQGNTLESTANNLRTTLENTVNAESVIRDTDFAEEISNFTNSQVLVQAGTSVLSSANQSSQLILSLLG